MDFFFVIAQADPVDTIGGYKMSDILTYGAWGAFGIIIVALIAKLVAGARERGELERKAEQEAALFEMSMLRGAPSASAAPRAPSPYLDQIAAANAEAAPRPLGVAMPAMNAAPTDSPAAASAAPRTGGPGALSQLAELVVARLKSANLLDYVEGPVRSKNPAITGTTIIMRSSQRFAILDLAIRQNDADFEILMRQFDGVIMPGPGKDPLFVKRFEYFISDHISL